MLYCSHMEIILILTAIIQSISISLGLGGSTLAIANFFVAIADGKIDENERRMMGVVYIVLRVAMILILVTTIALGVFNILISSYSATPFVIAQWIVIVVLFGNSSLMKLHKMPSTMGPALQAGSWYTLGILLALMQLTHTSFPLVQFLLAYVAAIAFAVYMVNGIMALLKKPKV